MVDVECVDGSRTFHRDRCSCAFSFYGRNDANNSESCAALTLAKSDDHAQSYAIEQIKVFVKKYAGGSNESMLRGELKGDKEAKQQLDLLRRDLPLIGLLQYAKIPADDPVLANILASQNEDCQGLGALVMTLRWPSQLFNAESGITRNKHYKELLAVAANWHSKLRPDVQVKLGETPLNLVIKKTRVHGIDGFVDVGFGIPIIMLPSL